MELPNWFADEEEELKKIVFKIAERQNINYNLVLDSRSINNAIQNILNSLVRIQENAKPAFDRETLDSFRELEKSVKKSGEEEIKNNKSVKWPYERKKHLSEAMKKIWAVRKANLENKKAVKLKNCEKCGKKIEVKTARKYCPKCLHEKMKERWKEKYHQNKIKSKAKNEAEKKYKHNYYIKNKEKYWGKKK